MKHIGRKLYHLIGGVGLLSLYYLLGRDRALTFYVVFFLIILTLDIARLKMPTINCFIFTRFGSFIRESERYKLTGTAPYVLGIGLSLYAFSPEVATAAICFLAFGDVAATTVGERYGRTKIGEKSLEGTVAFIAAALLSGLLLSAIGVHLMTGVMILGSLVAAGVELLPLPVNDNVVIPLVAGGVMELALRLFS
jgi:dolichol kinase